MPVRPRSGPKRHRSRGEHRVTHWRSFERLDGRAAVLFLAALQIGIRKGSWNGRAIGSACFGGFFDDPDSAAASSETNCNQKSLERAIARSRLWGAGDDRGLVHSLDSRRSVREGRFDVSLN